MQRALLTTLVITLLVATAAAPAAAVPPETVEIPFGGVIEGDVEACDLTLRWEVSGTVERTTFFNADGSIDRFQDKVRETNTITNVGTGETLQEGPDSFLQRVLFNDDGTVTLAITGLSVLVTGGDDVVVDAGRTVLLLGPDGVTALALDGRHDVRAIDPTTTSDPVLLEGFCAAF
jgi:hypothetical protein